MSLKITQLILQLHIKSLQIPVMCRKAAGAMGVAGSVGSGATGGTRAVAAMRVRGATV